MEQTPSPSGRSPELPSVSPPSNSETNGTFSSPEFTAGGVVERQEQRGESAPRAEHTAAPPVVLPAPLVVAPQTDDSASASTVVGDDDLPTVANDDELIEKEWVTKAKKVIAETKDDPYRREQEVSRLQADYLSKRYGRELGLRSEE